MVTKRAAPLITRVLAVRIVLGPRKPSAQPRALLQRRIERVEGVGAELADLHLAEHRPDGAADISLVCFPGGYLEIGGLEGGRAADLRGLMVVWADLRTHMKRYVKALQILCLVRGGLRGCVVRLAGNVGHA